MLTLFLVTFVNVLGFGLIIPILPSYIERVGGGAFASDEKFDKAEALREVAERYDHSLLDIAMGWLASRPQVSSVIAGVTSVAQLEQNVAAGHWRGSAEELKEIDEITRLPEEGFGPRR